MGRTALIAFLLIVVTASMAFAAAGPKFYQTYGNKHNLRGNPANTATYKAAYDPANRRTDEICIFCHTPHSSIPSTPLWGRKPTVTTSFGHYSSTSLVIDNPGVRTTSDYNEPNGSSRLCLSCHDGATALGAVLNGPEIPFDVGKQVIAPSTAAGSYNIFNPTIGDVTNPPDSIDDDATKHHHPISFKYNSAVKTAIESVKGVGYTFPSPAPSIEQYVKLDRNGYMQCTTCHNPHQDMSGQGSTVPFWVLGKGVSAADDYDTVCLSCHPGAVSPSTNPPGW